MSSRNSLPGALRRLITEAIGTNEMVAASLGINPTDLRCLELAASEPEMTPSRLAELSHLTSGAVTGVLDRLERGGFLRRESDPTDRRRLLVRVDSARWAELEAQYAPLIERAVAAGAAVSPAIAREGEAHLTALTDALAREADRLRVATYGGILDDAYQAPIGEVARARLVLHTGAPRLNVGAAAFGQQVRMVAETAATRLALRSAEPDGELIRASFVGPPPDVRTSDGTVTMRYRRRVIDTRSREIDAALHPGAAWAVEIENGITDVDADLRRAFPAGLQRQWRCQPLPAAPAAAERHGADRDRRRREPGAPVATGRRAAPARHRRRRLPPDVRRPAARVVRYRPPRQVAGLRPGARPLRGRDRRRHLRARDHRGLRPGLN